LADVKAADVMVTTVITVGPEYSVQDVAETLLENRISAVPVVANGGGLVGIVSEGDLIRRTEMDTERRRSRWLALLIGAQPLAAEFVKSHALRVADVMTRDVIVATPETPLRHIAELLEKNGIKRVPIVRNGKLVGIVSRANLVQALASARKEIKAAAATSDRMIREELLSRPRWNSRAVGGRPFSNGETSSSRGSRVDAWSSRSQRQSHRRIHRVCITSRYLGRPSLAPGIVLANATPVRTEWTTSRKFTASALRLRAS
jgi:CBS domain-containing protein